jgi:hypothetical protein
MAYSCGADTPPVRAQPLLPRSDIVNAQKCFAFLAGSFTWFLALFVRGVELPRAGSPSVGPAIDRDDR